ncbi:MAG: NAD(P)/FAD-dependent oxidoreductase [Patescibacteria group bacterium]|jgi:flavin-dependent dehydrogenase
MEKDQIVIIGAGPAGLIAAAELAKAGKNVLVFDQNKEGQINGKGETKLCGGGLTPLAQEFLGEIKSEVLENRKVVLKTVHASSEIELDFPIINTINRDLLAKELTERAKSAGADIKFEQEIQEINFKKKSITVDGEDIPYSYLVGADGVLSVVRKGLEAEGKIKKSDKFAEALEYKVSIGEVDRPLTVDFDYRYFSAWYAWIFPHKDYVYIGAGESGSTRRRAGRRMIDDLKAWAEKEHLPFNQETVRGWTIPYGYMGHQFDNNVFLAGDAGGFVTDVFGEGILSAMYSGYDVAHLILDKNYKPIHIEKLLLNKKRQARLVWFGVNLPLLWSISVHLIVLLSRNRNLLAPLLRHFYLWPEKKKKSAKS